MVPDTITMTAGNTPGFDGTAIDGVTADESASLTVDIYPDPNSTHPNADYQANFDCAFMWDESADQVDLIVTANWDTDPGSNVTYKVGVNGV